MSINIITIEDEPDLTKSVLLQKTQTVIFPLSESDNDLIKQMKEKLYELGGVGLAATQVNSNRRIAVVYIPKDAAERRNKAKPYPMHVLINAEYQGVESSGKEIDFEGCYSVQTQSGDVPRYKQIELTYQDEQGKKYKSVEQDFYARVLQHEIDHLDGILITDRLI